MAKNKEIVNVDISCKQAQETDTLTKDGQRTTYTGNYKGTLTVGDAVVTVAVTFKSDDKDILESVVPLTVGAKRMLSLSVTNEDLSNHVDT